MNFLRFIICFITVVIKLSRPGGVKSMAAENMLLRQQLISIRRKQKRSPKLIISVRLIYGILASFINPRRLSRLAIVIKPKTLLRFHQALVARKYHLLFANGCKKKPGPKGPSAELISSFLK